MKGMKKTSREFQKNDICQITNDVRVMSNMCMAPEVVVKESRKHHRTSKVSAKEIMAILMMVLGIVAIVYSLVQSYFMTYPQFYSQYVFLNMDGALIVLVSGFVSFICGMRLAWSS